MSRSTTYPFPRGFQKDTRPITERINCLDDVFAELGVIGEEVIPWPDPLTKGQRSQNANAIISTITEVYNEGEDLDWNNASQPKYCLYFEKAQGGGWRLDFVDDCVGVAVLGAGHYFKTEALARDAYSKFKGVWDEYLPE